MIPILIWWTKFVKPRCIRPITYIARSFFFPFLLLFLTKSIRQWTVLKYIKRNHLLFLPFRKKLNIRNISISPSRFFSSIPLSCTSYLKMPKGREAIFPIHTCEKSESIIFHVSTLIHAIAVILVMQVRWQCLVWATVDGKKRLYPCGVDKKV